MGDSPSPALSASSAADKPSLLVTNSLSYADPIPHLFSLSLVKAAQRGLVMSLAKTFNFEWDSYCSGDGSRKQKHEFKKYCWSDLGTFDQEKDAWSWEIEILE